MKLIGITVLALLVATVLADPEDELIAGSRTFTAKLYRELIKNKPNQNVIFSSITIQTLMALLSSASRNENHEVIKEIRKSVNLPSSEYNTKEAFKAILPELNKADNDFKVFDATKMYFKSGYWVEPWYQTIAQTVYNAEIEVLNFGNSYGASQNINAWVAKKTNQKITNFIDYYDVSANTQNLLINTLYLMGKWDKPFLELENVRRNFYGSSTTNQVEMMSNNQTYDYFEDGNAQFLKLEMLRDGGGAEMVFVLPKQQQGLSQLENNIEYLLQPGTFKPARVEVLLPKFTIKNDMKLKPVLQSLGVNKLFKWGAELQGLKYPGHPYTIITDVLQKAFIDVNEWGVTAAAAGIVKIHVDSPKSYKVFTADHPFLFYITVDDVTVYAGRVVQV